MTTKEFLKAVKELALTTNNTEVLAYATAELDKIENRKLTPLQKENLALKEKLKGLMEPNKTYIQNELGVLLGVSSQKAGAIVRLLVEDGDVVKSDVKLPDKSDTVKGYTFKS